MISARLTPSSARMLSLAMSETVMLKGADPVKTVNKAAAFLASFGIAKIPAADPKRIEAMLRTKVRGDKLSRISVRNKKGRLRRVNRESAIQNEWRNTLAAVIVAAINYGKHRGGYSKRYLRMIRQSGLPPDLGQRKPATTAQFYRLVSTFVKRRMASAGYHKSGLVPALKAFKAASNQAGVPKFKFPPGSAEKATDADPSLIRASMEDFARAIDQIAPEALSKSMPEVAALFRKWLQEDLAKAAAAHGLRYTFS